MSETIKSQAPPACPQLRLLASRNYTCAEATKIEATFQFKRRKPAVVPPRLHVS
jgi:hypothetical protein